ncbi:MAG TPA: gliding motility-associated C-terminal domain-containing protein, partial [Flavobacteriales bacterium]|nr:gliding motility-associated C-terminal domain-containing protein [Flavobacteriales bacterium]
QPAYGYWSIVSGPGSLNDPSDSQALLSGLVPGQTTVLAWTVENGPCTPEPLTDLVEVVVYNNQQAAADAGPDQSLCEPGEAQADMFGNAAVLPATGSWSIIGEGTIADPANPHTTVSGIGFGSTTLVWTIDNGVCGTSTSEMTVSVFDLNAPLANAGPDQALCHDTTFTIMAAVPASSTASGHWELIGGHGSIEQADNATTTVTGLQLGNNIFQWVLDNGACGTSYDTMLVVLRDCSILVVPDAFSPNGDGVNDTYVVQGLEYYSGNKFQVFNRWGSKVYERSPYRNDWDGTSETKAA